MKLAITHLFGDDTTSSSKIFPPLQATSNLKNVQSKAEGTRKGSPQSRQISKGKRSMPVKTSMSLEVSNDQEALKRRKTSMPLEVIYDQEPLEVIDDQEPLEETDIPSQQLAIVNPSLQIVETEDNKALVSLEAKKIYYPFGFDAVYSIDVLNCFPAPSYYVYRRLNPDWVKLLTLDMIQDTKFEEILGIVMPIDPVSKQPLQNFTKEEIPTATYWIISGQHSISAAKHLQTPGLPKVTMKLQQQFRHMSCNQLSSKNNSTDFKRSKYFSGKINARRTFFRSVATSTISVDR